MKITSPEDYTRITSNSIVEIEGRVSIPMSYYFRRLENVTFLGYGPDPCITGFPLYLEDCKNISFRNIAFRLYRPSSIPQYEKWWGWRIYSTVPNGSSNISFSNCIFQGNTDEFAIHPDFSKWDVRETAGKSIRFSHCLFGPSLLSISPERRLHNHALSIGCWKDVVIENSVFLGHSRRCPQIQGEGIIRDCCMYGWGTMGIGIHQGSKILIRNVYGHSTSNIPLVSDVVDTGKSKYGILPKSEVTLRRLSGLFRTIDPKCIQYKQISDPPSLPTESDIIQNLRLSGAPLSSFDLNNLRNRHSPYLENIP